MDQVDFQVMVPIVEKSKKLREKKMHSQMILQIKMILI